jgi:hypothetical protein
VLLECRGGYAVAGCGGRGGGYFGTVVDEIGYGGGGARGIARRGGSWTNEHDGGENNQCEWVWAAWGCVSAAKVH